MPDTPLENTVQATSYTILQLFTGCIREECQKDALEAIRERLYWAFVWYDANRHDLSRYQPSDN